MEYWKIRLEGGYQAFWFLEIIAYCAVDTFAIISGYMATNKSQNYTKLISMWFQVFFYSFICTVILKLFYIRELPSIKELIKAFFPFTFNQFWYFSAYVGAFLVIPFLNNYLFNLDKLKANKILIGCIFLFCCVNLLNDPLQTQSGYSALWIIVLYCVGVLARRGDVFIARNSITLIILLFSSVLVTWIVTVFVGVGYLVNYTSPTIVLNALILVVLFSRLKLEGTEPLSQKLVH